MKSINLRKYYPSLYSEDYIITVPDEVEELFRTSQNAELAYQKRKKRNKATYSLDASPHLESYILHTEPSALALCEQKNLHDALHHAMNLLTEKQYRRLSAHLFQHMSLAEIARTEGVSKSSVQYSIEQSLKIISSYLNDNL